MHDMLSRALLAGWRLAGRCLAAGFVVAGLLAGPTDALANAPKMIAGAVTVGAAGVIELVQSRSDLVILDSRRQGDFEEGHVEGAVRLIDDDIVGPDVLEAHGVARATPVLFYCNGPACGRAAVATERAVEWGFENVFYYYEGMTEWKAMGLPLVR